MGQALKTLSKLIFVCKTGGIPPFQFSYSFYLSLLSAFSFVATGLIVCGPGHLLPLGQSMHSL